MTTSFPARIEAQTGGAPRVLVGLIGSGIQASRMPALHMREGAAHGLDYRYRLLDIDVLKVGVEALPRLLADAQRDGFAGLNVTHPCKQAIIPLLDGLSDDARTLGAVNTVVLRDGRTIGHNTDWFGYAESFKRGLDGARLGRVVQLGAGGAGSAVAYALLTLGARELTIFDTDPARPLAIAAGLADRFGAGRVAAGTDLGEALDLADGLVNTTPVGMAKYPGMPLPADYLRAGLWVSEIIYFPMETELLRTARALGCRTLDGGGMAVFQAVEAFRLFSGITPDIDRMLAHFAAL